MNSFAPQTQRAAEAARECEEGGELALRRPPMTSEALLQGRRLVEISHNGEVYRLQATRQGKLLLTK